MAVVAETPRLVLRTWSDDDVDELARLGTADVVRHLDGEAWTTESAQASITLWRQIERRLGVTTWAVGLRGTNTLVGTCGFAGTNVPWLRFDFVIEIGWTLGRAWWGQGFATEAGRAALRLGIATNGAARIISKCNVDNRASERVMHRIGMERVGFVRRSATDLVVLYRVPPLAARPGDRDMSEP